MRQRLLAPRRLIMTAIAITLAFVWLSQIVASMLFRDAIDPVLLSQRITWGLFAFTLWQVIKTTFRTPVEPFAWTTAERQMLHTAPVQRHHLVGYRFFSILGSVLMKAAIFPLVLMADLQWPLIGFIGMFLALTFCECVRLLAEVILDGVSTRVRTLIRISLASLILWTVGWSVFAVASRSDCGELLASPAAWQFIVQCLMSMADGFQNAPGSLLIWPFRTFTQVVLTSSVDTSLALQMLMSVAMAGGGVAVTFLADSRMAIRKLTREQREFAATALPTWCEPAKVGDALGQITSNHSIKVPHYAMGVGPIAWRQLLGAWNYRSSIGFSFLIPVILCCLPLFADTPMSGEPLILAGSIAFYSYLLLPAALMLDFRRDVDRFSFLKSLPISPLQIVIGQLVAPVLLCSVFQGTVLLIAGIAGAATPLWLITCWLMFIPMNCLIMGLENLVFMLHPYRRNREGIDVFLRTILAFTGKGLIWAAAAAAVILWSVGSRSLVDLWSPGNALLARSVFVSGGVVAMLIANVIVIVLLTKLFDRFDPGEDLAAVA